MDEKRALHNIILENRGKLIVSGVSDVGSFDEHKITAYTEMGELTVNGENLNITRLSVENGELNVEGKISSLAYSDEPQKNMSFFARMFR